MLTGRQKTIIRWMEDNFPELKRTAPEIVPFTDNCYGHHCDDNRNAVDFAHDGGLDPYVINAFLYLMDHNPFTFPIGLGLGLGHGYAYTEKNDPRNEHRPAPAHIHIDSKMSRRQNVTFIEMDHLYRDGKYDHANTTSRGQTKIVNGKTVEPFKSALYLAKHYYNFQGPVIPPDKLTVPKTDMDYKTILIPAIIGAALGYKETISGEINWTRLALYVGAGAGAGYVFAKTGQGLRSIF